MVESKPIPMVVLPFPSTIGISNVKNKHQNPPLDLTKNHQMFFATKKRCFLICSLGNIPAISPNHHSAVLWVDQPVGNIMEQFCAPLTGLMKKTWSSTLKYRNLTHTWSGVKNSGRLRTKMIFLVEKQNKGSKWFRFAGLVEKSRSFKIRFALFCWRAFLHFSSPSSFPKKAAFKGFWNSGTRKNLRQENMLRRTHSHMYMTFVFVWKAAKMVPIVFVGSWANPGYVLQLLHMLFIAAPSLVTSARSLTQILPNPPVTVLINLQLLNALPGFCEMSFFQKCSHYFRVKWASPIYYTCPFGNDRVWHRWVSSPEMLLTKSCTVTSCPNIQLINPHFISFSKTSLWPVQVETWVFKVSHMRLHRMTHKLFSVQTCLIGGGDNLHKPRTL